MLACLIAPISGYTQGAAPVEIRRVNFGTARDSWLQVEIELRGSRNQRPGARNERFVDRVKVYCTLSYQFDDRFDFYTSELELVGLEQNKSAVVSFFLPGILVERDRIRREPFAYLVELEVAGQPLPIQEAGVSANIRNNAAAINSLKSRAELEGEQNLGILIPAYAAPLPLRDAQDMQAYIRVPSASR